MEFLGKCKREMGGEDRNDDATFPSRYRCRRKFSVAVGGGEPVCEKLYDVDRLSNLQKPALWPFMYGFSSTVCVQADLVEEEKGAGMLSHAENHPFAGVYQFFLNPGINGISVVNMLPEKGSRWLARAAKIQIARNFPSCRKDTPRGDISQFQGAGVWVEWRKKNTPLAEMPHVEFAGERPVWGKEKARCENLYLSIAALALHDALKFLCGKPFSVFINLMCAEVSIHSARKPIFVMKIGTGEDMKLFVSFSVRAPKRPGPVPRSAEDSKDLLNEEGFGDERSFEVLLGKLPEIYETKLVSYRCNAGMVSSAHRWAGGSPGWL